MPRDVIMPALGMAQETGQILAWHKKPGEAVEEGDVLFEVETDKAAIEVEAQSAGYLTDVAVEAGAEVPVGQIIASISETPEGGGQTIGPQKSTSSRATVAEPKAIEGETVIMPALGMAQGTGLIIAWATQLGDHVSPDDVLLEVETDKSAMEVPAGYDGYIAEILADAGESVPVGDVIAVISPQEPTSPANSPATDLNVMADARPKPADTVIEAAFPTADTSSKTFVQASESSSGTILASPKAKRLAREQGLNLDRLAEAGIP